MKIARWFLDNILAPVVVLVLWALVAFGSEMITGDWTEWFRLMPKPVWLVLVLVIIAWVVIIVVRKRLKRLKESDAGPIIGVLPRHLYGWISLPEHDYAGVKWKVWLPSPGPFSSRKVSDVSPSSIEVAIPPRCPDCETELEQSRSFWGGYVWRCVACGFKRKNPDSYYREAERVEKIARRAWEKMQEEEKGK